MGGGDRSPLANGSYLSHAGARRERVQELADALPGARIFPLRVDLRERGQREASPIQPRMGKNRIGRIADASPQVEDVDVDLPRTVREGRRASDAALHLARCVEESPGGPDPRDLDDRVPEIGLIAKAEGLGPIERRDLSQRREPGDFAKGGFEVSAPVSDVRAETEVSESRARAEISTLLPAAPRGRSRRSRPRPRGLRRRRALPLRWVRALHRTRRDFLPEGAP